MSEEKTRFKVFGYPLKDWVIAIAFLTGVPVGAISIGGTPGQTTEAIREQEESVTDALKDIRDSIDASNLRSEMNARRIDDLEDRIYVRLDSIQSQMTEGYKNLDGYFRGRLDQIGNN